MKIQITLEDDEVKEAIEKFIYGKVMGNPEIIIAQKGDAEFEILVDYTASKKEPILHKPKDLLKTGLREETKDD